MTWTDTIFLKLPNEAAYKALPPLDNTGGLDVVGTMYRDDTGEAVEGYHVNLRLRGDEKLPAEWQAYVIEEPAHPKRDFA